MKCLSIRPPWSYLILQGKDIENRTWTTKIRGEILIHQSQRFDYDAMQWLLDNNLQCFLIDCCLYYGISAQSNFKATKNIEPGIIGSVNLDGIVTDSGSVWAMPDCYHWQLSGAKPLPFMACKGKLGIYEQEYK